MTDFDPVAILAALERHRIAYILTGDLAGVLQGSDLLARKVEVVPSLKPENLERLERALADLDVGPSDRLPDLTQEKRVTIKTPHGEVDLDPSPAGSTGYADLRRAAERQPIGQGLRPAVASPPDLVRTLAPGSHPDLGPRLRRIIELERTLSPEL